MAALNEIPGIGEAYLQLLEAAGMGSAEELAVQDPDWLVAELKEANSHLSLAKRAPGKSTVENWISQARELTGHDRSREPVASDAPEIAPPVNYEENPEVAGMLAAAPCAIPLPGRIMMEKGLRVADVPVGLLLNRYPGDLDVRIGDPNAPKSDVPSRRRAGNVESISSSDGKRHFEASAAKPITPSPVGSKKVPVSKSGHEGDRVALIRAPREETNRGKDPESRRYIRGVLHTHPWSLRMGALFALLMVVVFPAAMVSALLLLLSRESPENFGWVPHWILAFPVALPAIGIGYMIWGMTGKCRICNQKLFVHRGALKHMKAHHIPGIGYVIPLCFHLLSFSWFRCSSCGTPVRLKK